MRYTKEEFDKLPVFKSSRGGTVIKKISDDVVVKSFDYFCDVEKESIAKQYGKANDSFIFPFEEFYIGNKYTGYLMKFINGPYCSEIGLNDLRKLLILIDKVKKDLNELMKEHLVAWDIWEKNCIFDTQFRFIDTNGYEYCPDLSEEEVNSSNYIVFNTFFKEILFDAIASEDNIKTYMNTISRLALLYNKLNDRKNPIFFNDFLSSLMEIEKVNSYNELSYKILEKV